MGSIRHPKHQKPTQMFWAWCEERNIVIYAAYVNTKENTTAHRLSRCRSINTEFELSQVIINSRYVRNLEHP